MNNYSELKRLAEAASVESQGVAWAYEPHGDTGEYGVGVLVNEHGNYVEGRQGSCEMSVVVPVAPEVSSEVFASFIASANPSAVLALIAEVERLSFREKMLSEYGCEYCAGSGHVHRIDGDYLGVCDSCSAYEFNCAKHEIEKLKNENESLKKDAARYRTIKKDAISDGSLIERLDCNVRPSEWDSYIDSVSVK